MAPNVPGDIIERARVVEWLRWLRTHMRDTFTDAEGCAAAEAVLAYAADHIALGAHDCIAVDVQRLRVIDPEPGGKPH